MRARRSRSGLTVRAIAGTHTVLLGIDLDAPVGCLGFAIHRTDHTEAEAYWLRGMKTFEELVPDPPPGSDWSTHEAPIQAFQWGDYSAKPGHDYTYTVTAMRGTPTGLVDGATVSVRVRTEVADDGVHGIWFNRGVAGSAAFAKQFHGWIPTDTPDEDHPAMRWLSRGLGEAFLAFIGEALGPDWGLRGAFYEFTWDTALLALKAAVDRGVDVRLVVHGRDSDRVDGPDEDRTAAAARVHAVAAGLEPSITWRDQPPKGALQHNKFLVLMHRGQPVAVWTGSTNLTVGAVYGHSNVGHLIRSRAVAGQFAEYWQALADATGKAVLQTRHESIPAGPHPVPPPPGVSFVPSPRRDLSALQWYAALLAGATSSAHLTGAFGLNRLLREVLAVSRPGVPRTVLLDKVPARAADRIPLTDPQVRLSTGSHLGHGSLGQWAAERLTGFNRHVRYVHTKIIMIDPLGAAPVLLTGSANYSDASTRDNEENTLVIARGRTRASSGRAVARVADIYLTEYHRLFMHFAFRAIAERVRINEGTPSDSFHLEPTDSWTERYYVPGSWRQTQRRLFAGTG